MGGGKVQTICNYEVKKQGIKTKELDIRWNMFPMHKREMFGYNWQDGDDTTPFFVKYSYIWHYTGFGIEDRTKMMRLTWETYGANYTNYEEIKEGMLKGKTYDDIKGAG